MRPPLTSRGLRPVNLVLLCWAGSVAPFCSAQNGDAPDIRTALESAAASLETGDATAALEALKSVETVEPNNPWLWFYKGRAHALRGYPHEAIAAFDRALDALASLGNPDPPLTERIRADRRMVRRKVTHQSVLLGLAYDSNVTFRGGGATGLFVSGRGDAKFTSQWLWDYAPIATPDEKLTLGGHVSHAWHSGIGEFNYQDYGAFLRYWRTLNEHWAFDLHYSYDMTYLGNQPFLSNHSLGPGLIYRWKPTGHRLEPRETKIDYRIDARDFLFDTAPTFDRDGFANSIGIAQTFRFRPTKDATTAWDVYAGYRFQTVTTEGSEFDRNTHGLYVKVAMPLKNTWLSANEPVLQLSASWEFDDYDNRSAFDTRGRRRDDVITTVGLVLSQLLKSDPERGELILHLIVQWTDSDSNVRAAQNVSPFNYDKIVAGARLEWRF